jgi:hypothetical protein
MKDEVRAGAGWIGIFHPSSFSPSFPFFAFFEIVVRMARSWWVSS